jgi:hypothetical protein
MRWSGRLSCPVLMSDVILYHPTIGVDSEGAMRNHTDLAGHIYNVCVRSILDEGWVRALEVEPVATHRHYSGPARTILMLRLADQSEMLGLLNRLHDMGLTVLSVELTLPKQSHEELSVRWGDF